MRLCAILLVILCAVTPATARDYPQPWHWIVVTPDDQANWKTEKGENARINVEGNSFSASLNNGDILLKGTVHSNHITAVETLVGTDATPMAFQGEWQAERTRLSNPSNGWGSDRISLHAPGGFYLGLFRHVRSGAPPEK